MTGDRELSYDEVYTKLLTALEALYFYADPTTYAAIGFFPDPPNGAFMDDFEETGFLGDKPGKIARDAIQKILEEKITPYEFSCI